MGRVTLSQMSGDSQGLGPARRVPSSPRSSKLSARLSASSLWRIWSSPRVNRVAGGLSAIAVALLFLEGAATVEFVYTVRPSYVLFAAAVAIGVPLVFDGWRRLPSIVRWSAAMLLLAYVVAALAGDTVALRGQPRAAHTRDLVYVSDLVLGLGVVGLIAGMAKDRRGFQLLLGALLVGATAAALYGIYQWPARHFNWPLSDLNNALNTSGTSRGSISSGTGLLGWARIRGTFREPHLLATFLAIALPLAVGVVPGRRRLLTIVAAFLVLVLGAALVLTLSVSAWAVLWLAATLSLCVLAIGRGWRACAGLAAVAATLVAILASVLIAQPQYATSVTGRDAVSLQISTRSRTEAWQKAIGVWSSRPALGHGPGQSAVRLAGDPLRLRENQSGAAILGSAHGVPLAALVDAGVFGFGFWLLLFGSVIFIGARAVLREPTWLLSGVFAAALVAILAALVAGDRLELFAWVILALLLALGSRRRGDEPYDVMLKSRPLDSTK